MLIANDDGSLYITVSHGWAGRRQPLPDTI